MPRKITDETVALRAGLRDTVDDGPERDTGRRIPVELDRVVHEHGVACGVQAQGEARNIVDDTAGRALAWSHGPVDLSDILRGRCCRDECEEQCNESENSPLHGGPLFQSEVTNLSLKARRAEKSENRTSRGCDPTG